MRGASSVSLIAAVVACAACQRDRAAPPPAPSDRLDPTLTGPLIDPKRVRAVVPAELVGQPATDNHDSEHAVQQLYGHSGSGTSMVLTIETGFFHDEHDTAIYKHACPHYETFGDHDACVTGDARGFEIRFMLMPSHLVVDLAGYDQEAMIRAVSELPIDALAAWTPNP